MTSTLRLFQHTELEHTPFATFTNRLFAGIPFIVGVDRGLPFPRCAFSSSYVWRLCNFLGPKNVLGDDWVHLNHSLTI